VEFKKQTLAESTGAILAHSLTLKSRKLRKGSCLTRTDIEELEANGHESITVAIPEQGDIAEDEAAFSLASAICGEQVRVERPLMGRCNLWAEAYGLLILESEVLDDINRVHESMTVATLRPFSIVSGSQLLATVKAIPYTVSADVMAQCLDRAAQGEGIIRVQPFQQYAVALIQTYLSRARDSLLDKTRKVLARRLDKLNSRLGCEIRCEHREAEVIKALRQIRQAPVDMIIISGASAVVDRRDVIPAAITETGGTILHYGMPVDPGNLLLLASMGGLPVLGMPGCARSSKYNGFDMVLERLIAGMDVSAEDIMGMGVGGLLNEIGTRPQPRVSDRGIAHGKKARKITALVLAAGESKRMGAENKLLLDFNGHPMIELTVNNIDMPLIDDILVVTGRDGERIKSALNGYDLEFVDNSAYAEGLSTSIICGLKHIDDGTEAVLVVLGDMPMITRQCLERLVSAFDPENGHEICVPVYQGKRGNPVLWSRRFFHEMMYLEGDHGARHLLYKHDDLVKEVEMPDAGILIDFDTRESLTGFCQR